MEVKRRKDRSRSVIRIEKDKYAIFQRDWALFIWNENKRAKRANNFILLFRSRIILQLTVKILLQLLIEPSQEPIIGKQDTLREIIGR